METEAILDGAGREKRAYERPELVIHGTLAELTAEGFKNSGLGDNDNLSRNAG